MDITSREPLDHFLLEMHDSGEGDVDLEIIAERIVDISDICSETMRGPGQTLLKFARTNRGPLAQIQDRYKHGENYGLTVHLFPEELGIAGMVTTDYIIKRARILGCDVMQLAETIIEFSPQTPPEHS